MNAEREELLGRLEAHYKGSGWSVKRSGDGTLHADGPGGVTWILPARDCAAEVEALLDRLGLGGQPHISVYSLAA